MKIKLFWFAIGAIELAAAYVIKLRYGADMATMALIALTIGNLVAVLAYGAYEKRMSYYRDYCRRHEKDEVHS